MAAPKKAAKLKETEWNAEIWNDFSQKLKRLGIKIYCSGGSRVFQRREHQPTIRKIFGETCMKNERFRTKNGACFPNANGSLRSELIVLQAGCQRPPWTTAKYGQFDSPITISGSKRVRGTYPLPRGTNSFNFMQFFGKFGKIMS